MTFTQTLVREKCSRLIFTHWNIFIKNIEKEMIKVPQQDNKIIVKNRFGFDDSTMNFLLKHLYLNALFEKLATKK